MRALRELIDLHGKSGARIAPRRIESLRVLQRARLASARDVEALHEELCWLRAHPDDEHVLALAVRMLEGFERRADLRRFASALESSGIAGTDTRYPFFEPTASWLARAHPGRLEIAWGDRAETEQAETRLETWAWMLLAWAESCGLEARGLGVRELFRELATHGRGDAAFLLDGLAELCPRPELRRALYESLDLELVLRGGQSQPSRTHAWHPVRAVVYQREPLDRARPDLAREVLRKPLAVREIPVRDARALVRLAREAMVARARDLEAFMAADPRDARLVECGRGLELVFLGVEPRERLLLEAVYPVLMLRNGVPIGYVLVSALFESAEVAFNVFETFRGGDSAWIYGRVLAAARALLGAKEFSVPPYQLGHENAEGLGSGAWWFYAKLGFEPVERTANALARRELAAARRNPRHRTSRATLRGLVRCELVWPPRGSRPERIGSFPIGRIAAQVAKRLKNSGDPTRAAAERRLAREVAAKLGARSLTGWSASERQALGRWAPVLDLVPDLARWSRGERARALAAVRAKGGRREAQFALAFDAHTKLRRAVCRLARVQSSV